MSGTSEVPGSKGMDDGKSPKTPRGRKLVQGRLPFTTVDNKSPASTVKPKKPVEAPKEPIPVKKVPEDDSDANQNNPSKHPPAKEDLEDSSSLQEISIIEEDKESDMNTSFASRDGTVSECSLIKDNTPRQVEKKKQMTVRMQEKQERDRKKAEEKAERERLKKEKEEEKKRKEEEKEAEKKKKEEERKKKEEEREADKKRKEEEKKKKEEEKEQEKKRKEEEKKRKEEEKESEKKKKEEEERKKKERLSQVFTSFFTQKKTTPAKTDGKPSIITLAFPPFQIKENMKMAPSCRTVFDNDRKELLDQTIHQSSPKYENYLKQLKVVKGRKCKSTWPINKDTDVEIIDEDDTPVNKEDVILTVETSVPRRMKAKLLKFTENRRPAYWGTWSKNSSYVGPRRPFAREAIFDYEVESDDEWEEDVEPGESLTDSEGEGEEKEPADDYEVDNDFLVPHGYLSDEEGEKEEDERPLSPSAAKEMLKLKEEQFERELKEKTCHIKPSLIGCCWSGSADLEPQLMKVLNRYAAILCTASPIFLSNSELNCDTSESPRADDAVRSEKVVKRLVNETDVPSLIRLLHGTSYSKLTIVKEFQNYLERSRTEEKNGPSKAQIVAKISEIASWTKCTEAGAMNGRTCWLVHPEILERYALSDLSVVNAWEFSTDTKKRGRKSDDAKAGEDETPPPKSARVSLIKKFIQPVENIPTAKSDSIPTQTKDEEVKMSPVPKAKKRIALISMPTSASKRPRNESLASPLTNFLKKMATKDSEQQQSKSASDEKQDKEAECFTVE